MKKAISCLILLFSISSANANDNRGACGSGEPTVSTCTAAAEQGNADAQFLAGLIQYGSAPEKALQWFFKSANQGNDDAQYWLGASYEDGYFVDKNLKTAADWYAKSALQNNGQAQASMARLYAIGEGVVQNYIAAHMLWNLAAAKGIKNAAKFRDMLATKMTPEQIEAAQKSAKKWELDR